MQEKGIPKEPIQPSDEPPALEGKHNYQRGYDLKFRGFPSMGQLVSVAVATAVYTILSAFSISIPSGIYNISALFIAIGFGIPFALWFGGWALVIGYIGNFLGAGLLSPNPLSPLVAAPFGAADILQLGLPVLLYRVFARRFNVDPIGRDVYTLRGFIFFFICAGLPNILGGLYGNGVLYFANVIPYPAFLAGIVSWPITNILVVVVIGPLLLRTLGPTVERFGLTIHHLLN